MIFFIEDGKLVESDTLPGDKIDFRPCLCFFSKEDLIDANASLQINEGLVNECMVGQASKFESHEGIDYISLNIPVSQNPIDLEQHICIYFRHNLLIFVCDKLDEESIFQKMHAELEQKNKEWRSLSLEKVFQLFFDKLTIDDALVIESVEEEISNIEEALITQKNRNYISEIVFLRKKLLAYRRYYHQLAMISSAIEENDNGLLQKKEVRYFRILTNRTERLMDEINNLQDYVSQVREAYQTQVDINQNRVMKFFTVIASIFLPLTLIVGWYGMNFQMPEYSWKFGYPFVIIISVGITLFSLIYFKRHKWF